MYPNEFRIPTQTDQQENKIENKNHKKRKKKENEQKENTDKNITKHLNIMYTNPDTLSNKLNELESHAELYKADIVLIAEYLSKNPSSKFENIFNLENYNCL